MHLHIYWVCRAAPLPRDHQKQTYLDLILNRTESEKCDMQEKTNQTMFMQMRLMGAMEMLTYFYKQFCFNILGVFYLLDFGFGACLNNIK